MTALGSTTARFSPFFVTVRLSRGTTATCENNAPFGFQYFVQPHTRLCAHCPLIATATRLSVHWHSKVPPAKFSALGFIPRSTAGCIVIGLVITISSSETTEQLLGL